MSAPRDGARPDAAATKEERYKRSRSSVDIMASVIEQQASKSSRIEQDSNQKAGRNSQQTTREKDVRAKQHSPIKRRVPKAKPRKQKAQRR